MWIFSQYGFYSIVTGNEEQGKIQLRTRDRSHLQNLKDAIGSALDKYPITQSDDADYQFRLIVDENDWKTVVLPKLGEIDYGNFKNRVGSKFGYNNKYTQLLNTLWRTVFEAFFYDD